MAIPEYNHEDSNEVNIYVNELVIDELKVTEERVVETENENSSCERNESLFQTLDHDNSKSVLAKPMKRKTNFAVFYCVCACIMTVIKIVDYQERNKRTRKSKINIEYYFSKHKAKLKEFIEHPKACLWINKFVKRLYQIPRTILQTYVLNPQDYNSFIKERNTGLPSSLKESMQFEWCRLSSFANYPYTSISVIRLADAGFYYEGNENEVVCFSCGLNYKNWKTNDSPVQIHKDNSPNCSFVVDNLNMISRNNDMQTADISASVGACGSSPEASTLVVIKDNENKIETALANEMKTSETYSENNVTMNQNIFSPENSVSAGNDSRLGKENLANSTVPRRTNSEFATFSRNNTTGLIRMPENSRFLQSPLQEPQSSNSVSSLASNMETMNMGICLEKPKYPKFAVRTIRLSSFANCPSYFSQTPDELVTAGFFYTGIEDHCRCFFCGGGLRRWEVGDLPWTEHARWYPKCSFVIQCMGEKFIEDVQQGKDPENIPNSTHEEQKMELKGLIGFTNNPAVQTILQFGYEPNVVKSAYTSLQSIGIQDITASLLFETIDQKEEREHNKSACSLPVKSSSPSAQKVKNDIHNTRKKEQEHFDPNIELSIKSLEEENRNLKDQQTCKICLDEPVSIVFLPCGHMAACANCAPALRRCPICRAFIKGTVKAIIS